MSEVNVDGRDPECLNHVSHGTPCRCPTCTMPGHLDRDTPKGEVVPEGAVWWNATDGIWECTGCHLK